MDFLELDPSQIDIIREYQPQLEKLGVNLDDERLQDAINGCPHNLESGIQAFLEFCAKGQLEKPTPYLIKALRNGWKPRNSQTTPFIPVHRAADFDTDHMLAERIENYRRLCEMVRSHFHRSSKPNLSMRELRVSTHRPDLATVQQYMIDPILRPEMENAILRHPEWGYEITPYGVQEMEF